MGNLRINPTNKHFLVHPVSKHLIKGCPRIGGCQYCPGLTPKTITAVTSGITFCTDCQEPDNDTKWTTEPSVNPNGTFVLTQNSTNLCLYEYTVAATGQWTEYNGNGCTCDQAVLAVNNITAMRVVAVFSTGPAIRFFMEYAGGHDLDIFNTTATAGAGACDDPTVFSNLNVCNCDGLVSAAIGGTATLTP